MPRLIEDVLVSPRRRQILAAVQGDPGIAFRELSRRIRVAPGTLRHHLNVLCRARSIVERRHGATLRFFQAEPVGWVAVVLRREPALAVLHDWLKTNPRASQGRILEAMGKHGWPRSTTQHRLLRLVDAGLATVFLQGRLKLHSATQRSRQTEALPMEAVHAFA